MLNGHWWREVRHIIRCPPQKVAQPIVMMSTLWYSFSLWVSSKSFSEYNFMTAPRGISWVRLHTASCQKICRTCGQICASAPSRSNTSSNWPLCLDFTCGMLSTASSGADLMVTKGRTRDLRSLEWFLCQTSSFWSQPLLAAAWGLSPESWPRETRTLGDLASVSRSKCH